MAPSRSAAAALAIAALAWVPAGHGKKHVHTEGWAMRHHSFERTMTYDDTLGDWLLSASSMALRDRVQLLPSVRDRHGFMWSKKAIQTRDFELTWTLSATDNGEGEGGPQDGFVALWLSPDDVAAAFDERAVVQSASKSWAKGLEESGQTSLGLRKSFQGVGAIFTESSGATTEKPRQTVVGVARAAGSPALAEGTRAELVAQAKPEHKKAIDWMTAGTQVKLRVKPDGSVACSAMTLDIQKHLSGSLWGWAEDGVNSKRMLSFQGDGKVTEEGGPMEGSWFLSAGNRMTLKLQDELYVLRFEGSGRAVVEQPALEPRPALLYGGQDPGTVPGDWQDVFELPAGTLPGHGDVFIGFSGYTGSASYVEVDFHRLETKNFDASVVGEFAADVLEDESNEAWMQILEAEKRYVNQASQTEAIERLNKMLVEHVERYNSGGEQQRLALNKLEERLDKLSADMATYRSAAEAFSFEANKFDPEVVKGHILGIKDVLMKHKDLHDSKIGLVHQAAKDLKSRGGSTLSDEAKAKVGQVAQQAQDVEVFAAAGAKQTNYMLLGMVLSVALLGYLFLSRMRYYEKKHYI